MLYVPPGFGHGFVVLSERAQFLYKCTEEYDAAAERGIRWDDPDLAIDWPLRDVTVSEKDAHLPLLADAPAHARVVRQDTLTVVDGEVRSLSRGAP